MLINNDRLNKKQKKLIKSLDLNQLKKYIDNLILNYYNAVFTDDKKQVNALNDILYLIMDVHNKKYNIEAYINYSFMRCFINIVLNNSELNFKALELDTLEPNIKSSGKAGGSYLINDFTELQKVIQLKEYQKADALAETWSKLNYSKEQAAKEIFNLDEYLIKKE